MSHMRFHAPHAHLESPFGTTTFGQVAEGFARFFGTPQFLIGQTLIVLVWIGTNATGITHFDPLPFILLNLGFSFQSAYAAPLILLAQTRQADRDKADAEADARHREELATMQMDLLRQNTDITQQVRELAERIDKLTSEVHQRLTTPPGG